MLEVADIFREAGLAYRQTFASRLSRSQLKAMRDIEDCRTAALGGHLKVCDHCHAKQYSYHSCRNRHCPKCQGEQTRRWLETQKARLLPIPYFLLTFTLPAELRPIAHSHPKILYGILMAAAARALTKLAADPQFLGGRPGMMAVLHTWTRAMLYHPHAHLLVTAGGLSPDRQRWLPPRHPRFLVPGYALGILFRAKVRCALKKAGLLEQVPAAAWRQDKKWVVHVQHAGTGARVLDYLARYVFRIAIANSRLERFADGQVSFRYRDHRTGEIKHCTLPAPAFIERFLQHVLPRGFTKVRYYGVYSPSRKADLDHVKALLRSPQADTETPTPISSVELPPDPLPKVSADDRCPVCHIGYLRLVETLRKTREPP